MGNKIIPSAVIARTSLDEHGALLDVSRLPGEGLLNYSERLFDAYANRASSTYTGLLNGINRELNLKRDDVIEVRLRGLGFGLLSDPDIAISGNTITNNISFTNAFDAVNVTLSGDMLIDISQTWRENELRGFTVDINSHKYSVLSNTDTEIIVDEEFESVAAGDTYTVKLDLEDGELVGLGLELGNMLYRIKENTNNIIMIEDGELSEHDETSVYRIRAFNPRVDVTGSSFLLYKEYQNAENFQLEKEIRLREDVHFHKEIIEIINTTRFFEAIDLKGSRDNSFSFILNRQSSEKTVIKEVVPSAKFFKLKNNRVKEGSVQFTEVDIFLREGLEGDVPNSQGNFYVDYSNGIVKVNKTPSGKKTVSYAWNDFPFIVTNSKAVISAFNKEDSKEFLFLQQEMKRYTNPTDRFKSSIPRMDMIEYIAELLAVKPSNWGE